jgi:hypothetical protein
MALDEKFDIIVQWHWKWRNKAFNSSQMANTPKDWFKYITFFQVIIKLETKVAINFVKGNGLNYDKFI